MAQSTAQKARDTATKAKADAAKAKESLTERVKTQVEDGLETTQHAVQRAADQAGAELRKATQTSSTFVRENPGLAMAGALGMGVLIGLALRSRD
jgi:ElaB/YqjD/DUF883 family membrane-anchored ribosome-binding protein